MNFTGNASKRLAGKVAVVTGGASGIGEAIVKTFVANGAKVVIADLQEEPGTRLAKKVGGPDVARFVSCDVTNEDQVAAAVDTSVSAFGRLDIMCNNAGILGILGSIEKISAAEWDGTVQVLLKSAFLGIKHAFRVMRAGGHGGSIINTASVSSLMAGWGPHCYTTCKHALVGLTTSAAVELRTHNIRVNCLSPGATVTPLLIKAQKNVEGIRTPPYAFRMAKELQDADGDSSNTAPVLQSDGPQNAMGYPQDIANVALFLASDDSTFVSGQNVAVDASHALIPSMPHLSAYFSDSKMVGSAARDEDVAFIKPSSEAKSATGNDVL